MESIKNCKNLHYKAKNRYFLCVADCVLFSYCLKKINHTGLGYLNESKKKFIETTIFACYIYF